MEAPPLVLDAIVVATAEGAELVTSEGRLAEVSSRFNERDPGDHWSVLKHQFTFRLAMAHGLPRRHILQWEELALLVRHYRWVGMFPTFRHRFRSKSKKKAMQGRQCKVL